MKMLVSFSRRMWLLGGMFVSQRLSVAKGIAWGYTSIGLLI